MSGYAGQHRERADRLAQLKAGRRRGSGGGGSLAAVVAQQPSAFSGNKIAAVDKGITALDALPDRYSGIKTLYVSKNGLRSLEGVAQFRELRALSAADNSISDLDALRSIPAADIALEAASFEGNPIADLPNYRAHCIAILGPSLALLDNRAVTPEERAAAVGAVAHEATMLALMVANACLVHKLGRCVQLVKLHCELQCAVLGGQYGSAAGGGSSGEGVAGAGRGINRVLQLWDYEGSLGRQERHAIGLAIRREVARAYRRIVAKGGKPEGNSKLWQQAFAQVMLMQQETIAGLMRMLEEAKAEAATVLSPLTRPPSPAKRRALASEAEANGRVRQDREALIQELRDAFLALADTSAANQAALPEFEARIRELHAALEAAGDSGLASVTAGQLVAGSPVKQAQRIKEASGSPAGPDGEQWAIPAARPAAAPSAVQRPAGGGQLKGALKQPRPSSVSWSPARPSAGRSADQPAAGQTSSRAATALRPGTASRPRPLQQQEQLQQWQPDDGLAEYEAAGMAQCAEPQPSSSSGPAAAMRAAAPIPAAAPQPRSRPASAMPVPHRAAGDAAPHPASMPSSPQRPGPSSPQRSRPGSPSPPQWTPNPLARHSTTGGGTGSPGGGEGGESPRQGLAGVFRLLEREGRVNQLEALKASVAQYETNSAELQATNHELAEALQQVQQHARELDGRLADQRATAEAAAAEAAAQQQRRVQQLDELGAKLEEVLASRLALQSHLEAAAAERQQLEEHTRAERETAAAAAAQRAAAAAATERQLQARIAELEARQPVHLRLIVGYEAEWRAETVKTAALEARLGELQAQLLAHQRQQRRDAACAALAARSMLRRALLWWHDAAAEQAHLGALRQLAVEHHRRALLATALAAWRLATQRAQAVAALEQQRQQRLVATAWHAWRIAGQEAVLRRGLDAAASLHRQSALQQQAFWAWQQRAADCRQLDLPPQHPTMQAAAAMQRRRLLRSCLGAWRDYLQSSVLPRQAALQLRLLEQMMGSQRLAFVAWQQYCAHRRERRLAKAAAQQHYLRVQLARWRTAAAECKDERAAELRSAVQSKLILLRRGFRAWRQAVGEQAHEAAGLALAEHHHRRKLLAACWQGWTEWTAVCRGMGQRHAARLLGTAMHAWRAAAKMAERRRAADAFHQRSLQRRFRATLRVWREAAAARRFLRAQGAHAKALLERRLLGRVLAGWRRASLAGKLCHTLEVVRQLQGAVERVSQDLQHKAQQIDTLQAVRVTVEGHSESLSLQVRSLDADLAAAQQRAEQLQASAHAAQQELEQALAAKAAAEAAAGAAATTAAAAVAERDAATTSKQQAEAECAAACTARQAAELEALEAAERAEGAAAAAATAMAQAAAAAAALDQLSQEHQALQSELAASQKQAQGLAGQLDAAKAEAQAAAEEIASLQQERDRLLRRCEAAQDARATAEAEQQAALRQAERLTALCEQEQERCRALQAELAQVTERNQSLQDSRASMLEQLERFAAAVQRAEGDHSALQQAADALRTEQDLQAQRAHEAEAEVQRLAALVDSVQSAKAAVERQLVAARAEAAQASGQQQELAGAVEALRGERDGLAATVEQLQRERAGLEAAVGRLRDQLHQSNSVLEGCRAMLADCCTARTVAADQTLSLQELLRGVKAEAVLKDAAIKALRRENARLVSLVQPQAVLTPSSGSQPGGSPGQGPPALGQRLGMASPLAGATASPAASASSGAGLHASSDRPGWAAAPVAATPVPAAPGSPVAGLQHPQPHQFSFTSPAAASSAPSYIPLSGAQQQPSVGASAATVSPAFSAATSGRALGSQGAIGTISPASSLGQAAAALSSQLCMPAAGGVAVAAGELNDQRLSFLLELVVEKRITAAQAQQVINAAAEGDARPLLQTLDSVKRRVEARSGSAGSPIRSPTAPGAGQGPA